MKSDFCLNCKNNWLDVVTWKVNKQVRNSNTVRQTVGWGGRGVGEKSNSHFAFLATFTPLERVIRQF